MKLYTREELETFEEHRSEFGHAEKLEYVYNLGYYSTEDFMNIFLQHWKGDNIPSPQFHRDIWGYIDNTKDTNIIVPRGHGKTTAVLVRILQDLCYGRVKSTLYIASGGLGEEGIGKIRRELEENALIREIFGELVPGRKQEDTNGKWRQKELQLRNGCEVKTISKSGSVRGLRPNRIIMDDPQDNKDVASRLQVQKFNTWVFTSLYNTMLPGGYMIVLGTIVGNLCFVKYLRDEKQWNTIERVAIEGGEPLWKEMWSIESLDERKKLIGTTLFNQEFMNIPITQEDSVIKEHWIKYYDGLPAFDYLLMSIDPAISTKESADFSAINITGYAGVNRYVVHSKGYKQSKSELINTIQYLYTKYKPRKVQVETVGAQDYLRQDLGNLGIPVVAIRPESDKLTRLLTVSPQVENGNVFFGRDQQELIHQLTNFPNVQHDDEMDAFVYNIRKIDKPIVVMSF